MSVFTTWGDFSKACSTSLLKPNSLSNFFPSSLRSDLQTYNGLLHRIHFPLWQMRRLQAVLNQRTHQNNAFILCMKDNSTALLPKQTLKHFKHSSSVWCTCYFQHLTQYSAYKGKLCTAELQHKMKKKKKNEEKSRTTLWEKDPFCRLILPAIQNTQVHSASGEHRQFERSHSCS